MQNNNIGGLYKGLGDPEQNLSNYSSQFDQTGQKTEKTVISWQDYEFPVKQKNLKWLSRIFLATFIIGLTIFLLSHDYVTILFFVLGVLALVGYSFRKPKMVQFYIDRRHIAIGKHQFNFSNYQAYYIKEYEHHYAIVLIPFQRFAPSVSVFIKDDYMDQVVDFISQFLPVGAESFNMIDYVLDWFEL